MNRRVIDYELLENEAARGRTVNQLMSVVGVSAGTWYKRMEDDPEFKAAYVRGRERNGYHRKDVEASLDANPGPNANRNSGFEAAVVASWEEQLLSEAETIEDAEDGEIAEPEPSMREYILQAVGLGLHLPRQIAKDLSVPIYEVVRDADALVEGGELDKLEAVTFSGYYLPGTIPEGRPFLNGNGEIGFAIEAASNGNGTAAEEQTVNGNSTWYPIRAEDIEDEDDPEPMPPAVPVTEPSDYWRPTPGKMSAVIPLWNGCIRIEADIDLFSAAQSEVDLFGTICEAVRDFRALDAGE